VKDDIIMMKRSIALLFLAALLSLPALAQSYSAILSGANEVPAADPDGSGFAVITIDGTTLRYSVFVQNITAPTASHIHAGVAGTNGSIVVPFTVGTLSNGTTTITTELASQINANPAGFYVNVHTSDFPNGAIRGQLARATGDGTRVSWLPVIGKTTGQAGTNFVTDLRIINNGGAIANVTLDFFSQNSGGNSAPSTTKSLTVVPGEQKVLNDVMQGTLNLASGLGALKITSDQNVLVTTRVINDLRSEGKGTAGLAYGATAGGDTSGTMPFLQNNADYRTNIGYFNPSSSTVTATFVARRPDGSVLGTNTVSIPGFAMFQQPAFALLSNVSDATQNDFFVTWTSSGPLFAYASVTDNKTGDAVLSR
jgi:hypothetical protein